MTDANSTDSDWNMSGLKEENRAAKKQRVTFGLSTPKIALCHNYSPPTSFTPVLPTSAREFHNNEIKELKNIIKEKDDKIKEFRALTKARIERHNKGNGECTDQTEVIQQLELSAEERKQNLVVLQNRIDAMTRDHDAELEANSINSDFNMPELKNDDLNQAAKMRREGLAQFESIGSTSTGFSTDGRLQSLVCSFMILSPHTSTSAL
jgi:hypothetical protein